MKKILLLFLLFATLASPRLYAQERNVTGKVKGADGSGLPGVNVTLKGTSSGTITDADGAFSLSVPSADSELIFSFVGFVTETVKVGSSTTLAVQLTEDVSTLQEVVVSGLATSVKRSNLANSIASISAKELVGTTRAVTLDGAMNGKIVGANISANSGAPGGGFSVRLRGISSINQSSEPLYIVDGVYVNNSQFATGAGTNAFSGATGQTAGTQDQATNRIADINPADIESIEVLKGPSAAAIYGTRANAGVILITTKKGKVGKTQVQFGQDVGFASALHLLGIHKTSWDTQKINDGIWLISNSDMADLYAANGSGSKTVDYEKEVYGNVGLLTNSRLNVSGGTDKLKYFVAGTTTDEQGIQKRTGFTRNSIRMNLDFKLSKAINISINSNYLNTTSSRSFSGNDNNGVSLGYNLAYLPNWLEQRPVNGVYPSNPITGQNPLEIVDKGVNNERTNRFIQSFSGNLFILNEANHSLKLSVQGGVDFVLTESEVYMSDDIQFQARRANPGASRYTKSRNFNTNIQAFLIDELKVNNFNFTTSVGGVRLTTDQDISSIQGEGLKPGQKNPNTGAVRTPNQFFATWQDVGVVAQEEINWADKVIVTGGIRFDKSSLNGDYTKFYPFAKASAAVNLTSFEFWKFEPISAFKLRAAYGQTGNSPSFGSKFTALNDVIIDGKSGYVPTTANGNPGIKPETANEIEFGTDMGFLNNRITLEASFYTKNVVDFIDVYNLSPGTGVNSVQAFNIGDLENKGIELGLGASVISKAKFTWNTQLSYWQNRSKITKLIVPEYAVGSSGFGAFGTNRIRIGESPSAWYGTPVVGGQRTRYENSQPDYQISWRNSFTFLNNFEFSFLLHTSQGNYNASLNQELTDEGGTSPDWSNKSADGSTPVGVARQLGQPGITTRQFVQNASYIKLREVALYYNVPVKNLPGSWKNSIEGIRVGVSGNNLALWTDYYGYDPEASNFGNRPVGGGVDLLSFPSSKRIFFHLTVTF
ncbi:MAG: SusC/RagA family TonB-linked outer membrane protein [Cyclobacteriaceae bacterium]